MPFAVKLLGFEDIVEFVTTAPFINPPHNEPTTAPASPLLEPVDLAFIVALFGMV